MPENLPKKGGGMSIKQVADQIKKKYKVGPSAETIRREVKKGHVGTFPMKMGPVGRVPRRDYRYLCNAFASFTAINQLNKCAGLNVWDKMIQKLATTLGTIQKAAEKILNRIIRDTAISLTNTKLNAAEKQQVRWTTYQNLSLWFDSWERFLSEYGFGKYRDGNFVIFDHMKKYILILDKTCCSLDGSNGVRGGRPSMTYYDTRFPQLGQAMLKPALTTTMITGSNAAGEALPPHFQFMTAAVTEENESIRNECFRYMLDVVGFFGHEEKQQMPVSFGMNAKEGMDDAEFFEYLQKSIMPLYPDSAPINGKWVVLKCDSGPGRLNKKLLAMLRYHGFILFPGVPNTTAVSQETDQNYGPFQSQFRKNLQIVVNKRIEQKKAVNLAPWVVGLIVFGGTDAEVVDGPTIQSAFQHGFLREQCIAAWEKVGAVPLSRRCLQNSKVQRSIGDGTEDQQLEVIQTQSVNDKATHALSMSGYDGNALKGTIIRIQATEVITVPHTQARIDLLAHAKKAWTNLHSNRGGSSHI
jgi:hypothetical protein